MQQYQVKTTASVQPVTRPLEAKIVSRSPPVPRPSKVVRSPPGEEVASTSSHLPHEEVASGAPAPLFLSQLRASSFSRLLPTRGSDELCMHFIRFGSCKHGSTCRFIHDAGKVQLCRAYLRGECDKGEGCALSHDHDPDRQPECGMFLKAQCFDDKCRFLHIKKSQGVGDCCDFQNSYCSKGKYCTLRHYLPPSKRAREAEPEAVDRSKRPLLDLSEEDSSEEGDRKGAGFNEEEVLDKAWEQGRTLQMFE